MVKCAEEGEEHGRHSVEQAVVAAVVVGIDDGIVESGLGGVIDGLRDLLVVAPDAFDEGLFIVLKPDFVEGNGVVGRIIRLKERVDTMGGVFKVFRVLGVVSGIVHYCFAFIPIIDRHDGVCLHVFLTCKSKQIPPKSKIIIHSFNFTWQEWGWIMIF